MDGTIEVTSMASGYLQADTPPTSAAGRAAEAPFASVVQTFTQGSLHDHLFGYKVDLDVAGTANSLMRSDTRVGTFAQPWNFGGASSQYKYVQKTQVAAEGAQSTYNLDPSAPSMFMLTSASTNAWGVARSWGIQIPGSAIQLLDDTAPFMPASQWTKYNVAVTRRSEAEQRSCRVLYDMQAPGEPLLQFDDFLNGESLVAQDLVAWVMVGSLHLPSSEDVPVTTTSTTTVRFFIRPLNYFNESPATDLTRGFFATGASTHPDTPALSVDAAAAPPAEACYDDTAPYAFAPV
jgi:primary-amine oxidase